MKTKFLLWLMSTRFYKFLLKYVIPEITIFHGPGPNWVVKESLRRTMLPGDVLLSKSSFHLTNLLIGGRFSHGAMVISTDKIAEMKANDFDLTDVNKFCEGATRIALLRLKPFDENYANQMANTAMSFSNAQYDTSFTLGVESLYCSELCFQSDIENRMDVDLSDLVGMGRPYVSPEGLYSAKGLQVIFEWADRPWS